MPKADTHSKRAVFNIPLHLFCPSIYFEVRLSFRIRVILPVNLPSGFAMDTKRVLHINCSAQNSISRQLIPSILLALLNIERCTRELFLSTVVSKLRPCLQFVPAVHPVWLCRAHKPTGWYLTMSWDIYLGVLPTFINLYRANRESICLVCVSSAPLFSCDSIKNRC